MEAADENPAEEAQSGENDENAEGAVDEDREEVGGASVPVSVVGEEGGYEDIGGMKESLADDLLAHVGGPNRPRPRRMLPEPLDEEREQHEDGHQSLDDKPGAAQETARLAVDGGDWQGQGRVGSAVEEAGEQRVHERDRAGPRPLL